MAGIKTLVGKKPFSLGSKLNPKQNQLANQQIISDVMEAGRGSNVAVTPVNKGEVGNFMPIPASITVTVTNTNDAEVDVKLFNNSTYTAVAGGVTVAYSDGFAGKLMDKLINGLQDANGLLCYGFNITGYDADGVRSDAVVNSSALAVLYYNGSGQSVPVPISVAGAERNTQQKDGLFTIKTQFVLNFLSQFSLHLGNLEKIQFVFFFQPIVD